MDTLRDAQRQLDQRLALAGPEDTCRGLFFNVVLDGLKDLAGHDVEFICRRAAGERKFTDFFSYPVSGFIRLGIAALPLVGARLGGDEAVLRWMGTHSTRSFLNSVAGKTALKLAGNDIKRFVNQVPISYRAAVSYGERQVVWTGETQGRVIFKRDFMPPAYHEGILSQVLETLGGRNVRVRGQATSALDSVYELSWDKAAGR
ncbi:DUF2378 family protein [Hyalangium rubrum]|uniref:DUF2378 family protein n=1 Tax=Hyalangium rubrum TaxID=3103134 RepID=A0ABU5GWT5_9BACT|nr:DUF2378 family protein [Hyalangium sp. s54d21]MDY7225649.1 DUF2378 family protein [Hyalangium sp. s54d21]